MFVPHGHLSLLPPPPLSLWLGLGRVCPILCAGFFRMMEMKIHDGTKEKVVGMCVCVCLCIHRLRVGCSVHIAPKQI